MKNEGSRDPLRGLIQKETVSTLALCCSQRPVIPQPREGIQNERPPPCRPGPLTRRRVFWQAPGTTFSSLVENEVHEDFCSIFPAFLCVPGGLGG